MAKTLDLNALEQPILEVKLRDENRTIFRLTAPTVKQYERFISVKAEMADIAKYQKPEQIKRLFDFTAELMSCNADYIEVTGEELRDKYRLKFGDIVVIFAAYLDFVKEFNNAKN